MNNRYVQLSFDKILPEKQEMLIAILAEQGFDGFEESDDSLKAFIPLKNFDETFVKEIATKHRLHYDTAIIEETNWNADWEASFPPVIVDDFVAIRADFHAPVAGVEHEIVITPKMSFGTGHHATTLMMIQQMRQISFIGKTVFDFGTGTGILSILAEKLGAAKIIAVDYDEWSITNTKENIERNHCQHIWIEKSDRPVEGEYEIILANINKHVIMEHLPVMAARLKKGGILLISGLLITDEMDLLAETGKYALVPVEKTTVNNWIALRFSH